MKIVLVVVIYLLVNSCCCKNESLEEKVFNHFRDDSVKQKAALFLLENMKWHQLQQTLVKIPDEMERDIMLADSMYTRIAGELNNAMLNRGELTSWLNHKSRNHRKWRDTTRNLRLAGENSCYKDIDAEFLISHINHAVSMWRTSPFAKKLTFDEFCEYILPFSTMGSLGYVINNNELDFYFGSHLRKSYPYSLENVVASYTHYINNVRKFTVSGDSIPDLGWKDIFFAKSRDCVPQCDVECNALRAIGVPSAVDMNIGNREYTGTHHHCVVIDGKGKETPFHGERNIKDDENWGYITEYKLNIYRYMFGAQKDSPYMLIDSTKEGLPLFFKTPTIKDVTNYIKPIYSIKMPIAHRVTTNLTWLYTYSREESIGMRAITWGINDTTKHVANFEHVVGNMFYVPAQVNSDDEVCFTGEPFVVQEGLNIGDLFVKPLSTFYQTTKDTIIDLIMTRKFPRKPNMIKNARAMVGGIWYGSQHKDGRDKVKLAEIKDVPEPRMQELEIKNPKAYTYYIFEAKAGNGSYISELEFITSDVYGYSNIEKATSLEILWGKEQKDGVRTKLLPKSCKGQEFDGNQQTSTGGRARLVYEFPASQVVTKIAFAPQHANNGIYPDENYCLYKWGDGWEEIENVRSKYNYLEFKGINTNGLYWLKNMTSGKEEVPFIIYDKKPRFLYYDYKLSMERKPYRPCSSVGYSVQASSQELTAGVKCLFDADTTNIWHTQYRDTLFDYPHWVIVDTHFGHKVDGVVIKSRGKYNLRNIMIYGSNDGAKWTEIGDYELQNVGRKQEIYFYKELNFRYYKLEFLNGYGSQKFLALSYVYFFQYK